VVARLWQQQAGEQGLGAGKEKRKVKQPQQRDSPAGKSSPVPPQAKLFLLRRALSVPRPV